MQYGHVWCIVIITTVDLHNVGRGESVCSLWTPSLGPIDYGCNKCIPIFTSTWREHIKQRWMHEPRDIMSTSYCMPVFVVSYSSGGEEEHLSGEDEKSSDANEESTGDEEE